MSSRIKVALFGHFGAGNFGNECTLSAMLEHLQRLLPTAEISCICTAPDVVVADYHIKAFPLSRVVIRPWKSRSPLVRLIRKAFVGVPSEIYRWLSAAYTLRDKETLIVVGTGLLTNAFGVAGWGPYSVFKWTAMARLIGSKVCFVSIGAGPLDGFIGRSLAKAALSLATYRSYRDDSTMLHLRSIGFRSSGDQICPDLAFTLPAERLPEDVDRCRRIVGIGVMAYGCMYGVEPTTPAQYTRYKDTLLSFCEWLLVRGYDIRLLIGDRADIPVLEEMTSRIREVCSAMYEEHVFGTPAQSAAELLTQLGATDFVVATRFHNVLLALLLNKPSISISFHHKCSSLMNQMGLSEYYQDIQLLSAESLIALFCRMEEDAPNLKRAIGEKVGENRRILDEQYRRLLDKLAKERPIASLPNPVISGM